MPYNGQLTTRETPKEDSGKETEKIDFEKIKEFKRILNAKPQTKQQKYAVGLSGLIFGSLLLFVPGWILFGKLQFLSHPRLFLYFPSAYGLLFTLIVLGFLVIVRALKIIFRKI